MKFFRKDLVQQAHVPIQFEEAIAFDLSQFQNNHSSLRELKDVTVVGVVNYDLDTDQVFVHYDVSGVMVCACSISNEDVDYPFETSNDEVYSFVEVDDDEEDIIFLKDDVLDLSQSVFQTILFEVPLRILSPNLKEYPKGDGWEVLSEADYQAQEKPLDPRLAKLREFKVED